ncbi:hypothetical protein CC86DRAFT_103339 [Ophiobolus disseminans]|uniref:Uncharacterized protein n=1 Tax=Ophiobolus disseminans TaxID=1469910 RepID=A0A6A6ZKB0_9PLEO|nr:hypothetical protein CC86DRAFT_103339 [Ophiobolus disseminans]
MRALASEDRKVFLYNSCLTVYHVGQVASSQALMCTIAHAARLLAQCCSCGSISGVISFYYVSLHAFHCSPTRYGNKVNYLTAIYPRDQNSCASLTLLLTIDDLLVAHKTDIGSPLPDKVQMFPITRRIPSQRTIRSLRPRRRMIRYSCRRVSWPSISSDGQVDQVTQIFGVYYDEP